MSDNKKKTSRGRSPGHGLGHMPIGEKAKDFRGTLKKLLHFLGHYKIGAILVLVFAMAGTVFFVVGPKILGNATTEIYNGIISQPEAPVSTLTIWPKY